MPRIQSLGAAWQLFHESEKQIVEEFKTTIVDSLNNYLKTKKKRGGRKKDYIPVIPGPSKESVFQKSSSILEEQTQTRSSQRTASKKAAEKNTTLSKQTRKEKLRNPDVGKKPKKYISLDSTTSPAKQKDQFSVISYERDIEQEDENKRLQALPPCFVVLERCEDASETNYLKNKIREDTKDDYSENKCDKKESFLQTGEHSKAQLHNSYKELRVSLTKSNVIVDTVGNLSLELFGVECNQSSGVRKSKEAVKKSDEPSVKEIPSLSDENEFQKDCVPGLNIDSKHEPANLPNKTIEIVNNVENMDSCGVPQDMKSALAENDSKDVESFVSASQDVTNNTQNIDSIVPPSLIKPVRIKIKNRKYNDDNFITAKSVKNENPLNNIQTLPIVLMNSLPLDESLNKSSNNKRGRKRKSEDYDKPSKSLKGDNITHIDESTSVVPKSTRSSLARDLSESREKCSSHSQKLNTDSGGSSGLDDKRSRTKILTKPTVQEIVIVKSNDDATSEKEEGSEMSLGVSNSNTVDRVTSPVTPVDDPPPQRMTRTRTREMNKLNQPDQTKMNQGDMMYFKKCALIGSTGKENKNVLSLKLLHSEKKLKATPLASNNLIFSPTFGKSFTKPTPLKGLLDSVDKKIESSSTKKFLKETLALDKKRELMKTYTEESKRKREEKAQRVLAQKQAVEREKQEKLAKLQRDKEEKERILAENKRLKEEQLLQKKQNIEVMIKEAEERRLKEEEAKQARVKKLEEEKRRQAEERIRLAEEAKKLHEMRLAQEAKERCAKQKEAENIKKTLKSAKLAKVDSYELTPGKNEMGPRPLKNKDDYGISEDSGDSTDDEKQPKKMVPTWSTKHSRATKMIDQSYVHIDLVCSFLPLVVDEINASILAEQISSRPRTSSAIWCESDFPH